MSDKKSRKRVTRARVRNVEVHKQLYHFELRRTMHDTKGEVVEPGGVYVRKRHAPAKKTTHVTFEVLATGGGYQFEVGGIKFRAAFAEDGLKVRREGARAWKTVGWELLGNAAQDQMTLFKETMI